MQVSKDLLAKLSQAHGPPGYEDEVRDLIASELQKHTNDLRVDKLGNVFAEIQGVSGGPHVLVSAHMDEVGLIVRYVEDSGFLLFETLGDTDPRVLLGQRVVLYSDRKRFGVIGTKPPHILPKNETKGAVELADLYIDVGVASREEVCKLGLEVGATATFDVPFRDTGTGSMVIGKALDNRAGCAAALTLFEALAKNRATATLTFAFTVQEESGLRGATVVANQFKGDAALVIETAVAADSPDVGPRDQILVLGAGPALRIMDATMVAQRPMVDYLKRTAESAGIPYQLHINARGGTDAGRIHLGGAGIPTGVLSTPCRYLHGPSLMLDMLDLNNLVRLAEAAVRGITDSEQFSYKLGFRAAA